MRLHRQGTSGPDISARKAAGGSVEVLPGLAWRAAGQPLQAAARPENVAGVVPVAALVATCDSRYDGEVPELK